MQIMEMSKADDTGRAIIRRKYRERERVREIRQTTLDDNGGSLVNYSSPDYTPLNVAARGRMLRNVRNLAQQGEDTNRSCVMDRYTSHDQRLPVLSNMLCIWNFHSIQRD